MKPAFSVIFLTTLIGAAQGLFLALYTAEVFHLGNLSVIDKQQFFPLCTLVALVLTVLGVIASFFHLGHPERAWRSAAMWRTSWLSREVIALPLFMLGLVLYGGTHFLGYHGTVLIGAVTVVACLALFVCTAMIYVTIRFLQEWASPLTLVNYLLLGCASGLTLATVLAAISDTDTLIRPFALGAAVLILLAWVTRTASLVRNARLKPKSTLQSAIGIKHPRIVQKAQGFMGGSFNTRDFFHGQSANVLRSIKWGFLLLVFPVPLLCLSFGVITSSTLMLGTAFALQYVGLLAERWFFFAQANHPQNLYYQTIS
jgi:sulfite dehydrogenase (quinone) subunit SoeC